MILRILQRVIGGGDTVLRVKSWRPWRGPMGWEWPTVVMRSRGGQQYTASPVWDRHRLKSLFRRHTP